MIDNRTVITGSFNWSPSAAHANDETLLVIHSPQLAKHFTREMDRLWDTAELGITQRIQRKLERQKIRCGDGAMRRKGDWLSLKLNLERENVVAGFGGEDGKAGKSTKKPQLNFQKWFNQAIYSHKTGRLREAEAIYKK